MSEEFETFTWKGQKRYRCARKWESGAQCEYDTYDLNELRNHLMEPHNRAGKIPVAPAPRLSPIVDEKGGPIFSEEVPEEFQDVRFRSDEE